MHHRPANRREEACLQISLHKSTASRGSGANYRVRCSLLCVYRCTPTHTQVDTEGPPYPAPPCFLVLTFTLDFVCVHSCMHVCMCTRRYARICLHIYIHAYTNLCAYVYVCPHAHVYVCPHALVHVCTDLLELQLQVVGTYKYMELNSECTQHVLVTIKPSLALFFETGSHLSWGLTEATPETLLSYLPALGFQTHPDVQGFSYGSWSPTQVLRPAVLSAQSIPPSPWVLCIGMRFPQIFRETLKVLL